MSVKLIATQLLENRGSEDPSVNRMVRLYNCLSSLSRIALTSRVPSAVMVNRPSVVLEVIR